MDNCSAKYIFGPYDKLKSWARLDAFLEKYNKQHIDLHVSKVNFLSLDQQMYCLYRYYISILNIRTQAWDKVNILFHDELEHQLMSYKSARINHSSICYNYTFPINEYKFINQEPIIAIHFCNSGQFIFSNTLNHNIDLLKEYPKKFRRKIFKRYKLFSLELYDYFIYMLYTDDYVTIMINEKNEQLPLFYQSIPNTDDSLHDRCKSIISYICNYLQMSDRNLDLVRARIDLFFSLIEKHFIEANSSKIIYLPTAYKKTIPKK